MIKIAPIALMLILAPGSMQAQKSFSERSTVTLEIMKPNLDGVRYTFVTSLVVLSGAWPLSKAMAMTAEFPWTHWASGRGGFHQSETSMGNPYFGIQYRGHESTVFYEFGIRLPVYRYKSGTFLTAYFSDNDRLEGFMEKTIPLDVMVHSVHRFQPELSLGEQLGASMWYRYDRRAQEHGEIFIRYCVEVRYTPNAVDAGVAMRGQYAATEKGSFTELFVHQAEINIAYRVDSFKPEIFFRIPVASFNGVVNYVIGMSLTWSAP